MKQAFIVLQIQTFGKQTEKNEMVQCIRNFYASTTIKNNFLYHQHKNYPIKHNNNSSQMQAMHAWAGAYERGYPAKKQLS
ncbi:hypothetical protein [Herbaspirillum camelliae]|uniref:hypothetical protein n=1 Tax=Herbaspirillum camelliae TaxID=1892903 RepID=UPI00117A22DD|nr:hypothetical protein [Herbaspirillum camelliae]